MFPLVASLVLALAVGAHPTDVRVTMFEMAMPPTIGGGIIATRYGLADSLPSLIVGLGIVASFATLPLWSLVLHRV